MDNMLAAYLAGAMDSDGYFGIGRSTYAMRTQHGTTNPVFSERVGLGQVTPDIPMLLRASFGGGIGVSSPNTPNSKPLYRWHTTDRKATLVCETLLPYLRVKRRQAELILELHQSKGPGFRQAAYWFTREFPDWCLMEMISLSTAAAMLGHRKPTTIFQSIHNRSLVALPYNHRETMQPRIPKLLVERLASLTGSGRQAKIRPPELIAWRQRLYKQVKELNKTGVNGTSSYHLTGCHQPAG